MKTVFPLLLILVLLCGFGGSVLAQLAPSSTTGFNDLGKDHWASQAIDELVKRKAITGYADSTFKPAATVSRAEFAKMLVLAFNLPADSHATSAFADVAPSHWAFAYVEAVGRFMMGSEEPGTRQFLPNAACKREVAATAIVRVMGHDAGQATLYILERFLDRASITPSLTGYVALAVQHDILKGQPAGNGPSYLLKPQEPLTRAEAATLLFRLTQNPQGTGAGTSPATVGATPSILLTAEERALLNLMNSERARLGLSALEMDLQLVEIARMKSKDLADHGVFSHQSPTYGSPREMLNASGVNFVFMGENLADGSSARGTLSLWMSSQGHKDNILNPAFTCAGAGIFDGSSGLITVVIFVKRN